LAELAVPLLAQQKMEKLTIICGIVRATVTLAMKNLLGVIRGKNYPASTPVQYSIR
jgi:hypothetical protein